MNSPAITASAVDLIHGGKLLFVTQDSSVTPMIAAQTDALFHWLDVPRGFTLILFWRDDPRILKKTSWPDRRTVNGGYTSVGSNVIIVYRQEEWDRVVLHEAIHALEWDWDFGSTPMSCWDLPDRTKLTPFLLEAWTELYAEWLWCGWHNKSWAAQRAWMDEQAIQILARAAHNAKPWSEDTNVFAYYILKAALAPHIAFLWALDKETSEEEKSYVLCDLTTSNLQALRKAAASAISRTLSIRMTRP
jgi:hypothetical protein